VTRVLGPMLALLLLLATEKAFAQAKAEPAPERDTHRLKWKWRRAGWVDYVSMAALGGLYAYVEFGWKQPKEARWVNDNPFDGGVRSAVRGGTRERRETAGVYSDYLGLALPALVLIDSVVIPLITDDWNFDVAWQLLVLDAEASIVTGLVTRTGNRIGVRDRPDSAPCEDDAEYGELCFRGATSGFPSGHSSTAFTAAGLICLHHGKLPLYGSTAADALSCLGAMGMASANGALRLIADRHYASDVLIGAGVGLLAGLGLPYLTTYGWGDPDASSVAVVPLVNTAEVGAGHRGEF
jgi:membrane-associated phospholipid phosphatase